MSKLGGERYSVQNPIINYVKEESTEYISKDGAKQFLNLGWQYVSPDEALRLRGGDTGIVFKDIFISQLQKLNSDFVDHFIAVDTIKKIQTVATNIEGNFTVWEYLKGLKTVFVPGEKRERNITLIDTQNIDRNTFHVTDEFKFTNGTKTIRQDIVFLINGIPLLFVETKAASKIEGISEALDQIKRYHENCPELLAVLQMYALTNIFKYYYSTTWNTSSKLLFNWKDETNSDFEGLVKSFFDKKRVIQLIVDYILFTRQDDELKKVVLRPHQMRAINKIVDRALDSEKKRGLIWHTQGSGKTYTMIVTAQKIMENPLFENPTVIMLVDRNELESQLFGNIAAVGIGHVEIAKNKKHLEELLKTKTRGLIISMIHKFDKMPENINTRKNIFVLIDEAHRTTNGKLGNYLMGALPNATYLGFTGTPIDKSSYGEGTFNIFGKDDPPKGYLDKYSIAESIEDGTTVPLYYSFAPNELQVDKETLNREFLDLTDAEGISDIEKLNKILEKAVTLKNMLKNKERVEKVTKYIVEHYKKYVEPMGYKAFIVAVDREACTIYKKELDKHFPEDTSKVVISSFYNDPQQLSDYHIDPIEEKRIRTAFRKPDELPKILIVTEKLLTGFDAPILYCIYLDKPMRDHVLLQTIARVNRPYEDGTGRKKTSGFVLDFVGIFENLKKALSFDSTDIEGIIEDIRKLKEMFIQDMEIAKNNYLSIIKDKKRDKAYEAVLDHFIDEEKRKEFYKFFKELSANYEILSPDEFLRPYLDDFEILTIMYKVVKENYERGTTINRELTRKTAQLVQNHTKGGIIEPALDVYDINENTLKKIEESNASETEKVFNLIKSINHTVEKNGNIMPYLIPIAERAEQIAKQYESRQKTTKETLSELKKIINNINNAQKEQTEKNMSIDTFTIYWILKDDNFKEPEETAKKMNEILNQYPHWQHSEQYEREVRSNFYSLIMQSSEDGDISKLTKTVQKILDVLKEGKK